jgi:hypothetical protein
VPRISRRNPNQADLLKDGHLIVNAVASCSEDLPSLQPQREKLETKLNLIKELQLEALALQAKKQQITQEIYGLHDDCAKLIFLLHTGVKEHYGTRSEMLTQFGMLPFRGRPRRRSQPEASASPQAESVVPEAPQE